MSSKRNIIRTLIHNFLTGRPLGTLVQDPDHEAAEKAIVDFACLSTSPYNGALWPQLGEAIKFFGINDLQPGQLFFISQVFAHKPVTGGFLYQVQVSMAWNSFQTNCIAMQYILTSTVLKAGFSIIGLSEFDGSGVQGYMVINWDAVENIGDHGYGCQDYTDGALIPTVLSGGMAWKALGNSEINPPVLSEDFVADGSIPLIYCNPTSEADQLVSIITKDNLKGPVFLKNISSVGIVQIGSDDEYLIEKARNVYLLPGDDAVIRLLEDQFFATGNYSLSRVERTKLPPEPEPQK